VVPRPEVDLNDAASIGMICFGTSRYAVEESREQLRQQYGIETSYLRLKAFPFTEELGDFIDRHARIYVIEQNRDAQMLALMRMELEPEQVARLRSVRHYSGLPIDARSVTEDLVRQEEL